MEIDGENLQYGRILRQYFGGSEISIDTGDCARGYKKLPGGGPAVRS